MTTPAEVLRRNGVDALFHGHPDGVCVVDLDGAFVESNSAMSRLLGFSVAELRGMPFDRLVHPESVEHTWRNFRTAVAGENARYITRTVMPDGRIRTLDAANIPLRDEDGSVVAVLAIARDIGDVERAAASGYGNDALMRMGARVARFAGWLVEVPERRIVWSEGLYDLLAWPREAHPDSAELLALFEPAQRAAVAEAYRRTMREGEPLDVFGTIVTPDGRRIHAHLVGEPELDASGTVVRVHGAFHDVTAQVLHRQEQRAMARLLRSTLDQVHDAIAFVGRDWRFTFANSPALKLAAKSEAEMLRSTLWEVFPTAIGTQFEEIYRDAMERGVVGRARAFTQRWQCWFEVSAHPTDEGIAVIVRDVSEDEEARRRLDEYTERVEAQAALLDAARDAIIVRGLDGTVSYWNRGAETIYGISAEEAIGRSVRDLMYADPAVFDAATEQLKRDGFWVGELTHRRADGTVIIADCRWQLVRDGMDGSAAVLAVNSDITEHRRREEARHRTQRMESLGTLAGGIAHDLNNVLTPILMTVQLLAQDETDERKRQLLATMDGAAQRAAAMIKQVLSFARGSQGRREPIDVVRLLDELEAFCREALPRAIDLEVTHPDRLPAVVGDDTELFQVLVNLVTNARDAMPDGGRLVVSAREVPEGIRLEVADTGHGMSVDLLGSIFEPFFTTKESGTGLGLSTSAGIVKAHGGEFDVVSAPGDGTTFGLVLPRGESATGAGAAGGAGAPLPARQVRPGDGRRVLVVDDEPAIRDLVRQTLEAHGYDVEVATGAAALDLVADAGHPFDVVLSDLMMPGVSGDALAQRVIAESPATALVLMSGMQPGAGARAAVERDGAHFLPKPFTPAALVDAVDAALGDRASG
ncbi:hybrid sensor histidine kinase/response regulator [Leifsonia sp. AG29]|uniref:hybrid sensor histidine kinase/response regulator n=1 Tax=Leifsonia sp. AG29 TaxID=2598860 RepID=UPI001E5A6B06|nr:PAS domain S-box protein [Leifsonia sp. AG29]